MMKALCTDCGCEEADGMSKRGRCELCQEVMDRKIRVACEIGSLVHEMHPAFIGETPLCGMDERNKVVIAGFVVLCERLKR